VDEDPARAARLLGAAEALRGAIGLFRTPRDEEANARLIATVRAALGEERFAASWEEGRAMSLEQAIEYALEETPAA
jgi:AMMECR1 domain-containing protein